MKNLLKTFLYLLAYIGTRCFGICKANPEVAVLMYHSIDDSGWKLSVSEEVFRKQLEYLKENYNIVKLEEIVLYAASNTVFSGNTVALTFDDGYKNMYTTVFPLIKTMKIPITIFLTTNLERKEKLGGMERLSWQEVREMHESGLVHFEVHGHNHLNLKEIGHNKREISEEIDFCHQQIVEYINYRPSYIAYAFGHKDKNVIDYVRESGFIAGFTINEGLIKPGDNLFTLKRVQVDRTMNFNLFKMRLTSAVILHRKIVDSLRKFL